MSLYAVLHGSRCLRSSPKVGRDRVAPRLRTRRPLARLKEGRDTLKGEPCLWTTSFPREKMSSSVDDHGLFHLKIVHYLGGFSSTHVAQSCASVLVTGSFPDPIRGGCYRFADSLPVAPPIVPTTSLPPRFPTITCTSRPLCICLVVSATCT